MSRKARASEPQRRCFFAAVMVSAISNLVKCA